MRFRFFITLLALFAVSNLLAQNVKVEVDSIFFEGNKRTKEGFLRELILLEECVEYSQTVFDSLLTESEHRLNRSSLFKTVHANVDGVKSSGKTIVKICFVVDERWYTWPFPIFRLTDPNFNLWWRDKDFDRISYGGALRLENINGKGDELFVKIVSGFSQEFRLSYSKFVRKTWGLSYGMSYIQYPTLEVDNINGERIFKKRTPHAIKERFGVGVSTARQIDAHQSIGFSIDMYQSVALDSLLEYNSHYFGEENKSRLLTTYLSGGYHSDSRDNISFPHKGQFFSFSSRIPILGLKKVLWMNSIDFRRYKEIKRHLFSVQFQGQWVLNAEKNTAFEFITSNRLTKVPRIFDLYVPNTLNWLQSRSQYFFLVFKNKTIKTNFIPVRQFKHPFVTLAVGPFVDQAFLHSYTDNGNLYNSWLVSTGVSVQLASYYDKVVRFDAGYNSLGDFGVFLHFTKAL